MVLGNDGPPAAVHCDRPNLVVFVRIFDLGLAEPPEILFAEGQSFFQSPRLEGRLIAHQNLLQLFLQRLVLLPEVAVHGFEGRIVLVASVAAAVKFVVVLQSNLALVFRQLEMVAAVVVGDLLARADQALGNQNRPLPVVEASCVRGAGVV